MNISWYLLISTTENLIKVVTDNLVVKKLQIYHDILKKNENKKQLSHSSFARLNGKLKELIGNYTQNEIESYHISTLDVYEKWIEKTEGELKNFFGALNNALSKTNKLIIDEMEEIFKLVNILIDIKIDNDKNNSSLKDPLIYHLEFFKKKLSMRKRAGCGENSKYETYVNGVIDKFCYLKDSEEYKKFDTLNVTYKNLIKKYYSAYNKYESLLTETTEQLAENLNMVIYGLATNSHWSHIGKKQISIKDVCLILMSNYNLVQKIYDSGDQLIVDTKVKFEEKPVFFIQLFNVKTFIGHSTYKSVCV
jgi:hypothetical protein